MAERSDPAHPFVSRGGLKLAHALREFALSVEGLRCTDLGCSTGGFTECLLRHGALHVEAVDTGYGVIAWSLRQDPRVTVRERTNALHAEPIGSTVELVTLDLGWTPQRLSIPAALRWCGPTSRIITLVKPHYEASSDGVTPARGGLDDDQARAILDRVMASLPSLGARPHQWIESPIRGAKSSRHGSGNLEFLVLATPIAHESTRDREV